MFHRVSLPSLLYLPFFLLLPSSLSFSTSVSLFLYIYISYSPNYIPLQLLLAAYQVDVSDTELDQHFDMFATGTPLSVGAAELITILNTIAYYSLDAAKTYVPLHTPPPPPLPLLPPPSFPLSSPYFFLSDSTLYTTSTTVS